MTEIDFVDQCGLAATFATIPSNRSLARADTSSTQMIQSFVAQVAFAMLDEHQGKGIG